MSSSPKARDLTGSLVKGARAPRRPRPNKQDQVAERDMAFDPFSFAVWCATCCLLAAQVLLIVVPELI